ncbi:hypothetical protein RRG08_035853 [Elysia crispata]|uniref:Uncharacterized protein n=1 Tax=Elysia crispata TaxID=231223 RepID=A0AAE1DAB6_9GAST|nr:hypothetical protein RRG08_035853 [Elysia crispata]
MRVLNTIHFSEALVSTVLGPCAVGQGTAVFKVKTVVSLSADANDKKEKKRNAKRNENKQTDQFVEVNLFRIEGLNAILIGLPLRCVRTLRHLLPAHVRLTGSGSSTMAAGRGERVVGGAGSSSKRPLL